MVYAELIFDIFQHPSTWQFRNNDKYKIYKVFLHTQHKSDPGFIYWFVICSFLFDRVPDFGQAVLRTPQQHESKELQPSTVGVLMMVRATSLVTQHLKVRKNLQVPFLMACSRWAKIIRMILMMRVMTREGKEKEPEGMAATAATLKGHQTRRQNNSVCWWCLKQFFHALSLWQADRKKKEKQELDKVIKGCGPENSQSIHFWLLQLWIFGQGSRVWLPKLGTLPMPSLDSQEMKWKPEMRQVEYVVSPGSSTT